MSELQVQVFGTRKSKETRAAERFFKERKIKIHFVDLKERPIAKGELSRFVQKFGLNALLDLEGKAYERSNLAYLRTTEDGVIAKIIDDPELLRLPLVRAGKHLTVGEDTEGWKAMVAGG
ncbi:ArsC/Spx/MgsR family protein [Deinococcus sp. JMULE3]|uniref:ArsC/Spx/MgsR family protein n=1 Tax=Deinococcus sp. JMULE3 TaxID=2518341 RepID=UPI00157712A7|nr:ArsC/Spx/MgsR family protein [Deinococcus sp. JMULE3]NTY01121.1 arsenate reductase [Deinococcus sp. JMULE3]